MAIQKSSTLTSTTSVVKATPLMPKATAVWLIDNTTLTFAQIAQFCALHPLEVQSIADGETVFGITGVDPIRNRQITQEELDRCIAEPSARLQLLETALPVPPKQTRGPRYTPLVKRVAKPDAILWCLKSYPDLLDAQIIKLIGTTKTMINTIRKRSHWNMRNLQPRNPADVGLCTYSQLQQAVEKAEQAKNRARLQEARREKAEAAKNLAADTLAADTLAADTLAGDTLAADTLAADTLADKTFAGEGLADKTFGGEGLASKV